MAKYYVNQNAALREAKKRLGGKLGTCDGTPCLFLPDRYGRDEVLFAPEACQRAGLKWRGTDDPDEWVN